LKLLRSVDSENGEIDVGDLEVGVEFGLVFQPRVVELLQLAHVISDVGEELCFSFFEEVLAECVLDLYGKFAFGLEKTIRNVLFYV
jgi:hypothetical protein